MCLWKLKESVFFLRMRCDFLFFFWFVFLMFIFGDFMTLFGVFDDQQLVLIHIDRIFENDNRYIGNLNIELVW